MRRFFDWYSAYNEPMPDGSEDSSDQRAFIGFRCEPEVKERVEREAEERGTSVSEVVREGLPQGEGNA